MYKLLTVLFLAFLIKSAPAAAQGTTVFIDTFDFEAIPGFGGDPAVPYSNIVSDFVFTGAQIGGTDFSTGTPFNPDYLTCWSDGDADPYTYAYASAPIGYSLPFNPTLSSTPGKITWEFNMRTSSPSAGFFDPVSDETVVVLASSDAAFHDFGVGYAVSFTQSAPYSVQLMKFSDGLYGSVPVTILSGSGGMASGTNYVSVRVVFDATTGKWSLYLRDDGFATFSSPFTGPYALVGSTTNIDYTTSSLDFFGFLEHYDFSSSLGCKFSYFDNFRVSVDCGIAPIVGSDSVCFGSTLALGMATAGGTWSSSNVTVGTISTGGVVTGLGVGTTTIQYNTVPGCHRDTVINVVALPDPILGDTIVCVGFTATATDASTGGFWSTSDVSIATVGSATGIITGVAPGTVILLYTDPVTRCGITRIITVNALPAAITGPSVVCQGATITLANATTGGTWISSTPTVATIGGGSGIVFGVSGGVDTIRYRITATGCIATALVTVNASPAAITGPAAMCVGATATLASTTPGGTWSSGATGIATINAATGVISGVANGTARITYTNSTTGCFTTRVQTVSPVPAAITGTAVVCAGSNTTLATTPAGGAWSSSNTAVATVNAATGVVTGLSGGTATISYDRFGCVVSRVVTVNPLPAAITGSQNVCLGLTSTLGNTTTPGTWSSSNTTIATISAGGVITASAVGTTTISYTLGTGCARSVEVTVNPLPAAIFGTFTVCQGSTTALSNTTTGGTWSSSNLAVGTISAAGVVAGISGGTTTITYTAPTTCISTAVVSVNPLPAAIGGANIVCVGATVTATNGTFGGTWSSSNTSVATIGATNGAIVGIAAGTTTLTYTLGTGCFVTRTVTANPVPAAITGPGAVCVGITATLATVSTGGTWSSSNGTVASIDPATGIATGLATGIVNIRYTFSTGCFATRALSVNTTPPAVITPIGDTTFCPGGFVALTANTGTGLGYQWFESGTAIPGASSATYITSTTGSYQVRVSNGVGCQGFSIPMSVTVMPAVASITTTATSFAFCSGSSISLDAPVATGNGYQWELDGASLSGATDATYMATIGGTYKVIVTNSIGCSAEATQFITENVTPSGIVTLSGPLTFCSGSNVVMTGDAGSGISYQWYNTAGPIAGATNISYTATTSGNYWVIETTTAGCTATTPTSTVVVNTLPSPAIVAAGPIIFCAGGNVTLNASAAAGLTYQWYLAGAPIAGATNASYVAAASGGYRVRVTNVATGCTALTGADTMVNSVATPAVVPVTPATFCWGGSSMLGTTVVGAGAGLVSYQWFFNTVLIGGATNSTYNASVAGNYSVRISIPSSCVQTTAQVPVVEKPLPNPIISYNGTTHMLTTQSYYVSYQWFRDVTPIGGATAFITPATGNGNYKVQVTDTNGCQSLSAAFPLTNFGSGGTTGITQVSSDEVLIYPNPAQTVVHIEAAYPVRVTLSGIDGRIVAEQSGNAKVDININSLADGIYMVRVYNGNGLVKVEKLVKAAH
ncbi:MAG: Ig-like domain-containing protein [Bacteroidota bacterium]